MKKQKISDISALLRAGYTRREVAKKLKVHRDTVARYAGPAGQNRPGWPPAPTPGPQKSDCESHRTWIEEQVRLGRNGVSIYQDLVEQFGFTSKYNSVKRFVHKLKQREPDVYDVLEFAPGEECQVDLGQGAPTKHPTTGKYRRPALFVMTLRYSRRSFRKTVWKVDQVAWARLHEEAFRYFGGATQYAVLDNLKQGVIKPDIYEPELNPVYVALLSHYGVVADPARVADPDRKGSVEKAIEHTQDTALKGRRFDSIEQQNDWLMHWEERWAAPRVHGRAKRQVEAMFQEERPFLKTLPLERFRFFIQEERTVADDALVEVARAYYSAPPELLHQRVPVRFDDLTVQILHPATLETVRSYARKKPGNFTISETDRLFNPSRQTEYLLARARAIGTQTGELAREMFKEQGRIAQRRIQGIVSLARHFTAAEIERAADVCMKRGVRTYRAMRKLIELHRAEELQGQPPLIQLHKIIRPTTEYAAHFAARAGGAV